MPRVAHIFALAGVLSVSTLVCRSESIPSSQSSHEKTLLIFLSSDVAIPPAASSMMKQELGQLLQAAAIHVVWQDPAIDRGGLENDYSAVVRLRGSCRPTEPSAQFEHPVPGPYPLASSAVADGMILPFGDIDCGALNSFLGPSLWREPDPVREFAYARAVARLMAHEMYHVVGQTQVHAHSGVAEPSVTVAELLSDRFEFAESTLGEFHPTPEAGETSVRSDFDEASGK